MAAAFLTAAAMEACLLHDTGSLKLPKLPEGAWEGFAAANRTPQESWSFASDNPQVQLTESLMNTTVRIVPGAGNPNPDSMVQVRSGFALAGDFELEIGMQLPSHLDGGFSVAVFFSNDPEPLYYFLSEDLIGVEGFLVLSPAAGLSFNGDRGSRAVTIMAYDNQKTLWIQMPDQWILRAARTGTSFVFSQRPPGGEVLTRIDSIATPSAPRTPVPGNLYLHLAVGNFRADKADCNVAWSDFRLLQGEVAWP